MAPFVSTAFGLPYQPYTLHAVGVGAFLDTDVRPLIVEQAGDERLWQWHRYLARDMYCTRSSRFAMRLALVMLPAVPAIPAFGLACAVPALDSVWTWAVWSAGVLVLVGHVVTWLNGARGVERI